MKNIYGLTLKKLEDYFLSIGHNPAKARIVFKELYHRKITDFSQIDKFGPAVIKRLSDDFCMSLPTLADMSENSDTCKYLFTLTDNSQVETVLMKHTYGNGVCVSTQVGCNMDCAFCESGKLKKIRNLTAAEMVGQVLYITDVLKVPVTHIVLMGIGEPFDNYEEVIDFIDIITDTLSVAIGPKHLTVSTCGVVPKILEFSKRPTLNALTVSLHAPNDALRNTLMPINKKYPIRELVDAVRVYTESGNKKATFAYIMLDGINDSDECAYELAALLKGIKCYVNLIPYNRTSSSDFKQSSEERIGKFFDILKQQGTNVTVRRKFGDDLNAACGQLSANYKKGQ